MKALFHIAGIVVLGGLLSVAAAQEEMPLGDLARSLRKTKNLPTHTVIDNDNMSQVMQEVESRKLKGALAFSIDDTGKNLQMSSPDVTCSLSFSAQATPLISEQIVSQELPLTELIKLDGPAAIEGDTLEDMIKEDLVAERIAIDSYREIIQYIGEKDPTTRRIFEDILAQEEEHADDMADILNDL